VSVLKEDGFQIGKCERAIEVGLEVLFQEGVVDVGFGHLTVIVKPDCLVYIPSSPEREEESFVFGRQGIYTLPSFIKATSRVVFRAFESYWMSHSCPAGAHSLHAI
jgi:hypothetical protein